MLGSVDRTHVFELLDALAAHDGARLIQLIMDLRAAGLSAGMALEDMARVLQRAAVSLHAPASSDEPDAARMTQVASGFDADHLQFLYSLCIHGRAELGLAPDEYTGKWFANVDELRDFKRIGALLLRGRKPNFRSPAPPYQIY